MPFLPRHQCVHVVAPQVPIKQREALNYVSTIEESMVKGFPFTVPSEYSNLPQLLVSGCMQLVIRRLCGRVWTYQQFRQ